MKKKMMELVQDMVNHGWHLCGMTVEEIVDRDIGWGRGVEWEQECHDYFLNGNYIK